MTISDKVRNKYHEAIDGIKERSIENVEAKIQLLQQKGDYLDEKIGEFLLHTLGEIFEIAPAQERWSVYQNFREGHYHQVMSDLKKYLPLVKDPDIQRAVQELSSMIGMKYICSQEYFSKEFTTSK